MLELDEEQETLLENIVKAFQDGQKWSDGALTWEEIEEIKRNDPGHVCGLAKGSTEDQM